MFHRRWQWLVLLIAFVCAATLFVVMRVQDVGTSALRAEAEHRLAESLDAEVRLGTLTLRLAADLPWVGLEFQGARLQWPELILDARRIGVEVNPLALVLGRLSVHELRIEGMDVEWQEDVASPATLQGPGEALARLRETTEWLRENPCFLPDTEVRDAVIARRLAGERQEWLREISGEYDCRGLLGRAESTLRGQLPGIPETLQLDVDSRRGHFHAVLDFPALPLPRVAAWADIAGGVEGRLAGKLQLRERGEHGFELSLEAAGDALRGGPGEGDAVAGLERPAPTLRAEIQLEPDTLRVLNAELRDGNETASLVAHVQGLQALDDFDAQPCAKPRKLAPMPGMAGLRDWLLALPEDADPDVPSRGSLAVEIDALAHPELLCSLENVRAQLDWAGTDLDLELSLARLAGLSLRAQVSRQESLAPELGQHIRLEAWLEEARAIPQAAPAKPVALPPGSWVRGRITLASDSLGELAIEGASARLEARRSNLRFSEIDLRLSPENSLRGDLQLALDEAVPRFRGQLSAAAVPGEALWEAFEGVAGPVEGSTHATLELRGTLEAERELIASSQGRLDLEIRKGSLRARLPLLLALGTASSTSNPFRDRDRLPFEKIKLSGLIADGRFTLEHFELTSPALTAVSTGYLDLAPPYPADLEVALFFLPRASTLLKKVPVVGGLLLGESGSLAGAVFAVDGRLSEPEVHLVPGRTFSENLPGALLQGIPTRLRESAQRIGALVGGNATTPPRAKP